MFAVLFLSLVAGGLPQVAPSSWKVIKDAKANCQIEVPPDWEGLPETSGAAVFQSSTTAIAVVTSQPGQAFKPLTENLQKLLGIRKDKFFENTVRRIFYQDRISRNPDDPSAYSASVPAKAGTCSCRITVLSSIPEETVKKIALSLAPAPE